MKIMIVNKMNNKIALKQIHKCGISIYCDGEGCELNNQLEELSLSPNDIPEELIDLDKQLPIYTDYFLSLDYRVRKSRTFKIDSSNNTLRKILKSIYNCLEKCGQVDCLFIEQIDFNSDKRILNVWWGS